MGIDFLSFFRSVSVESLESNKRLSVHLPALRFKFVEIVRTLNPHGSGNQTAAKALFPACFWGLPAGIIDS
jgi:hypothetical protein